MTYPENAGYKEVGGCSQEAAAEMDAKTLRGEVLTCLFKRSLTADETAARLDRSVLAVRPRLSELLLLGLIKKTKKKRMNVSGKKAIVWKAIKEKT
jgi:predicted transcriptional regulator